MMRWPLLVLILAALLVACGAETEPAAQPAPSETAAPQEAQIAATEAPVEPVATSAVLEATEPASPTPTPTDPPAEGEKPTPQAEPTEVAEFGPFEGSYFRGRADAPILMYDYSDFL